MTLYVARVLQEGSYGTAGGDMDALKDYLVGRLLWDPTQNPQHLIDEFIVGYFGTPVRQSWYHAFKIPRTQ